MTDDSDSASPAGRRKGGLRGYRSGGHDESVFAIGALIVNFGSIELLTHEWLRELAVDDADFRRFARLKFKRRVETIRGLTADHPESFRQDAAVVWDQALDLARVRNEVAHSPIVMHWKGREADGEPDGISIVSVPRAKGPRRTLLPYMDPMKLGPFTDAIAEVAQALFDLLERLRTLQGGNGSDDK